MTASTPSRPAAAAPATPRARLLALACGAALALLAAGPRAQAQPAAPAPIAAAQPLSLPAQPLTQSLGALSRRFGVAIGGEGALLEGRSAPALQGRFTLHQALERLLAGSGLAALPQGDALVVRPAPAAATPGRSEGMLPAVTVTARTARPAATEGSGSYAAGTATLGQGAASLREIPQSVTVVTRQRIEDQNLHSVREVLQHTAGVTVWPNIEASYYARGYTMQTQVDGTPGMNLNFTSTYDTALYDRVEVLRGPSGLLSGSGEPGGVVNLVRKRPLDHFAASGSLGAGSWDRYRGDIDVSTPLARDGRVRGRAIVAATDEDSFQALQFQQIWTAYGVVEADLGTRTTLGLTASGQTRRSSGSTMGGPRDLPRNGAVGADVTRTSTRQDLGLDLSHRFGHDWVAKASLARARHIRRGMTSYLSAYDPATRAGAVTAYPLRADVDSEAVDASLSGPFTLWGRRHSAQLGWNASEGLEMSRGNTFPAIPVADAWHEHDFPLDQMGQFTGRDSWTRTRQSGLYGVARLRVLDPLLLVLGGRLSDYTQDTRSTGNGWVRSDARARHEFTPYGGLVFDLAPGLSLYTSYADIFVPQAQKTFEGETLKPRVGWQWEAGAKGEFLDGRLQASLAVFRMRDTNRALQDERHPDTACDGGWCYVAAGQVQSQGWEVEVQGSPLPGWELTAGYTRNDTRYLRDSNAGNVGRALNAYTPRHQLKLWGLHRFAWQPLRGWSLGAGLQAQSSTYDGAQGGYALYALQLGYRLDPHWSASLTANNLADKRYHLRTGSGTAWGGNVWNVYGPPRHVMLTVRGVF